MKVLILAGGLGSRLSEETGLKPKPMVEVGGKPILWHIMKTYSHYGFNEFVILLGYKGYYIKEYFANYLMHQSSMTVDFKMNEIKLHHTESEPWKVTLLETGLESMTGGRVKRAQEIVGDEPFMLTYGDGVGDIDISELVDFHQRHGKLMTMTAAQPDARFGALNISESGLVNQFREKPKGDGSWVNAGYFVCAPEVFNYICEGDKTVFEQTPLRELAKDAQIMAYRHHGFWMPMDTLRDKNQLNTMWENKSALWNVWGDHLVGVS